MSTTKRHYPSVDINPHTFPSAYRETMSPICSTYDESLIVESSEASQSRFVVTRTTFTAERRPAEGQTPAVEWTPVRIYRCKLTDHAHQTSVQHRRHTIGAMTDSGLSAAPNERNSVDRQRRNLPLRNTQLHATATTIYSNHWNYNHHSHFPQPSWMRACPPTERTPGGPVSSRHGTVSLWRKCADNICSCIAAYG